MKKVLFVATVTSHINGFHIPYMKWFKEQGYKVHVASNGEENIEYCDKHYNLPFERQPFKKNNLKTYKELKKIINENNYEIVHCHTPVGGVLARLAARKARKKGTRVIYTAHGFHFYKGAPLFNWMVYYPIEKIMLRYTDCLITITQEDYEFAKKKFKNIKQIEHLNGIGMNTKKFSITITEEEKQDLKQKLKINDDEIVLSYIAELNVNKNQQLLINVVEELVKNNNKVKLLLIGDGVIKEKYEQMVKKKKLQDNVLLLGRRKDIPQLLLITDIYVASSIREGLPVNVVEAMYMGLPIVATDNRGHRELIQNNINGFIVDNNVYQMKEKIELLIENKELCKKFSTKAKEKSAKYCIENIICKIKQIYFKKRKILYLLSSTFFSGAENVVCTIIKCLGDEFEMAYCSPNGKIANTLKNKKINYYALNKMSYKELKKVIEQFKPDIIHANDYRASCLAAAFYKKAIIISHIHINKLTVNKFNIKSILYSILSKRFKRIIWVSDSALDNYYFKKKVENKSIVLYNVIDSKEVETKSNLFECPEEYDLIFLGRLASQKNPERLIKITKTLVNQNSNIKLAIVGDGELRDKIEKMIKEYEIKNNVILCGYKDNPYPYLKKAKILIMTSKSEGTPMCALEALSLGVIVISTPVDGLKKIIINGKNGFLLNSDEEICKHILKLLKNDKLIEEISKSSKKYFEEINDISLYISKLKDVYK